MMLQFEACAQYSHFVAMGEKTLSLLRNLQEKIDIRCGTQVVKC